MTTATTDASSAPTAPTAATPLLRAAALGEASLAAEPQAEALRGELASGSRSLPVDLSIGFASTVGMWAIGYLCMTSPGLVVGEILFAVTIAVLFCGGVAAGRLQVPGAAAISPWRRGLRVGLVSAAVNLLIVGSLFGGTEGSLLSAAVAWIGGLFAVSAAVGTAGGVVGGRLRPWRLELPSLGLFGLVAAAAVFLLLITGGLVTGLRAGLAVPDWPNSFGHNMLLYPLTEMTGGVYYEHAHRLYGMLVGVVALTLAAMAWSLDGRRSVRWASLAVLAMVCVQGLLGGLRVTGRLTMSQEAEHLAPNLGLAIVHGAFGQVVFATFVGIAAATSLSWRTAGRTASLSFGSERLLTTLLPAAVVMQLVLGACYRHLKVHGPNGLEHHPLWALHAHIVFGVVVAAAAIGLGVQAWGRHGEIAILRRTGLALAIVTSIQLLLGLLALAGVLTRAGEATPLFELLATSAHQSTGALVLAISVLLAMWTRRLLADAESTPGSAAAAPA
jgi:cytochrome c oxidase assembly protein subunit 15